DELFFVDLPKSEVRLKIFEIHLKLRNQDSKAIAIDQVAAAAKGFSGAEIEQAIVSALYAAHAQKSALTTELLLAELKRTRPLSIVMAEKVDLLRRWASGRTVACD
ncbi:MAG: ATPase, partial [Woeseia sp.]|nr:ATPase [Woeseia sp.]